MGTHANTNGFLSVDVNGTLSLPFRSEVPPGESPFMYHLPGTNIVICVPAKCASTEFKSWLINEYALKQMKDVHSIDKSLFRMPSTGAMLRYYAVFRHPSARFMSAFNDKISCDTKNRAHPTESARLLARQLRKPLSTFSCDGGIGPSPMQLAEWLRAARIHEPHFASQAYSCNLRNTRFDTVLSLESLRLEDVAKTSPVHRLLTKIQRMPIPLLNRSLEGVLRHVYADDYVIADANAQYAHHREQQRLQPW